MSLEIEARFSSPKGQLLLVAWFEGSSTARLVVTGPAGEREEVQIKHIDASLAEEVTEVLRESILPDGNGPARLTAKLQLTTPRERIGRAVRLGDGESKAGQLCGKLLRMAELVARDEAIQRAMGVVREHLGE